MQVTPIVKPDNIIYILAKYSILFVILASFVMICFFGNLLRLNTEFNSQAARLDSMFELLRKVDQERFLHLAAAYKSHIDENLLAIAKQQTDKLSMKFNTSEDFKDKLEKFRNTDFKALTSKEQLEYFDSLDFLAINKFSKIRELNVNPEINAELNTIHMILLNNIALNKLRDFLFKFSDGLNTMTQDDFLLLDNMRFKFSNYVTILEESNIKISYMGFSFNSKAALSKEIAELSKRNDAKILQLYDLIRSAIILGRVDISSDKLVQLASDIEDTNIKLIEILINSISLQQQKAKTNLLISLFLSFLVLLIFSAFYDRLRRYRIHLLESMYINKTHMHRIKEIAKKRGVEVDSKQMQDLLIKAVEFVYVADTIEQKNKNEYSYFMTNVSHEIMSPLNDIIGFTELLYMNNITAEQAQYIEYISTASQTLKSLFENLLKISKLQSDTIEIYNDKFNIMDIVYNITQNIMQRAKKYNIEFLTFIDPQLDGTITCDQEKFSFIITKLLENAIKYNVQNGSMMLIIKKVGMDNKKVIFSIDVIDSGKGMDNVDLKLNFIDTNSIRAKLYATGNLDLAIVNNYLQFMGSELHITNQKYKGTHCNCELRMEFAPKDSLKDKFKGDAIIIHPNNMNSQNTYPILENFKIPSYQDILISYLDYLGISYKISQAKENGLYFIHSNTEPFVGISKCILASIEEPIIANNDKVWLQDPFNLHSFVEAYELVTGKGNTSFDNSKLSVKVLALADDNFIKELNSFVNSIDREIIPNTKYDLAFVDVDIKVDLEQIKQPCHLVAISSPKNSIETMNSSFSNFIIKSDDANDKILIKDGIEAAISDYKRKVLQSNKKLRDVLLFKKSYTASYIFKNAISLFTTHVDVVHSIEELENKLQVNSYKVVLCDYDIEGFSLDKYISIINKARSDHHFNTVAGLFAPKDFKIFAREFEIIYTDLSKTELESQLKKYFGMVHEY